MKKFLTILLIVVLAFGLFSCNSSGKQKEWDEWPERGLGASLPQPDTTNIDIGYSLDTSFTADLENTTMSDFSVYITKCEEVGFTIEADSNYSEYSAYNQDGYYLELSYQEYSESIHVSLTAPKASGTLAWPSIGLAALLPAPNSTVGNIQMDSAKEYEAWIGEIPYEDYQAYVKQCMELGFDVDYQNSEKEYTAENADGIALTLEYHGFNTVHLILRNAEESQKTEEPEEPTEPMETAASEEPSEPETTEKPKENLVNGLRPEFKEAMDSYEEFFEEYCTFMKKYENNPSDVSLLLDYAKYMGQYTETMEKMDAWDSEDMNDAETLYYLEVQSRITKMLLEVAG